MTQPIKLFSVLDQCYCMPDAPNDAYTDHKGVCQYCQIKERLESDERFFRLIIKSAPYHSEEWNTIFDLAKQACEHPYKDSGHPKEYDEYVPTHQELSNKHTEAIRSASDLHWSPESDKPIEDILGIPTKTSDI